MLLGIHIVARNEADVLGRCLQSVQGLADEITVIDTGSTDGTAALAQSFGARVVEATWEDDFAAARNAGLDAARTVWVLVLDADEWLHEGVSRSELRGLLRSPGTDAFGVTVKSAYGDQAGETVAHEAVRLFRADRGFRYAGVIHEQLVHPGRGLGAVNGAPSKLVLLHDGYMPSVIARKGKAERNLRLIEKALRLQPDDPFQLYNKGVTLCQLNKPKDACAAFSLAYLSVPAKAPYRPTLVRDWAKAMLALGDAPAAASLLYREVDRYADYPDLQLLYGDSLMRQRRVLEARSAYEAALEAGAAGSAAARYVMEAGAGSWRARCGLAAAEAALGRAERAQRLYAAAAAEAPRFGPALAGWAEQLLAAGERDEAIRAALASSVGLAAPADLALQARVLGGIGAYDAALPLWREAGPLAPAEAREYAACLAGAGRAGEARAVLRQALAAAAWAAEPEPGEPAALGELTCELGELCVDLALYGWSEGVPLDEEALALLGDSAAWALASAERAALEGSAADCAKLPAYAARLLLERALQLGLLALGARLGETACLRDAYPALLYRHGYTHAAAGLLLAEMAQRPLREEELFCLGELLYGKGLYGEALPLFEQAALLQDAAPERARLGAAACSLALAREALLPWAAAAAANGGWPQSDLEGIGSALARIQAAGWQTAFTGAERRRAHVQGKG